LESGVIVMDLSREELERVIPKGSYCYGYNGVLCPFWKKMNNKPNELSGYCSYLNVGDWMDDGMGELWNHIKECDINIYFEDGEY
jgi:hypothetical protein